MSDASHSFFVQNQRVTFGIRVSAEIKMFKNHTAAAADVLKSTGVRSLSDVCLTRNKIKKMRKIRRSSLRHRRLHRRLTGCRTDVSRGGPSEGRGFCTSAAEDGRVG